MESIKRIILINVPTSICNFRCNYCYLTHRDEYYKIDIERKDKEFKLYLNKDGEVLGGK